jgi:FkbM family methyltransferase
MSTEPRTPAPPAAPAIPRPSPANDSSHGWRFRLAVLWQQFKNFSRLLKFYWESLGPAPMTPYGFRLHGNKVMQRGAFEPEETALARRCMEDAEVFINVGANIGYYCLHALQMKRKAVAFEPIDLNVRHLLCNVRLNGWQDNIELFPVALSDKPGVLEIFGGGTGASLLLGWAGNPAHHVSLCPVARMDDVLGSRFSGKRCFVLVDIEGAEYRMLLGASGLLQQNPRPVWFVEVCQRGHNGVPNPDFARTFELFWNSGYSAWVVVGKPRQVQQADVFSGAAWLRDHVNFLFVAADSEPSWLASHETIC